MMPNRMETLSEGGRMESRAKEILHLVADHIWEHGYQPSIREICKQLNWSSLAYCNYLLKSYLEKYHDGLSGSARAIHFPWRQYVTDPSVSRDKCEASDKHPAKRVKAARKKARR
jgi:SOS-response transcriptional repressor LexA